ncbi:MAG: hypothetical protein HGB12_08625 [Bacteroidetes bacterium]|nr:hypothetical protein [Bacteroidota bacterium]
MKFIFAIIFTILSFFCLGQDYDKLDSNIVAGKMNSSSKLIFINSKTCECAKDIAKNDLKKDLFYLFIIGGITPLTYTTDSIFERKYNVKYFDYGCIAARLICIEKYNWEIFDFLEKNYSKTWKKDVRSDVIGLKKWKSKKKKNATKFSNQ